MVWHWLNFMFILSNPIWSNTQYWWSSTKIVKYWDITIRNWIIKMIFWVLAIPHDTNNMKKKKWIMDRFDSTGAIPGNTWPYFALPGDTWQYPTILDNTWQFFTNILTILTNIFSILINIKQYLPIEPILTNWTNTYQLKQYLPIETTLINWTNTYQS